MPSLFETPTSGSPPLSAADRCSRCGRPSDVLLDRGHGERVCLPCREKERERFEAETGLCINRCGYDLAWHAQPRSRDDDCPTEDEARRRSGTA